MMSGRKRKQPTAEAACSSPKKITPTSSQENDDIPVQSNASLKPEETNSWQKNMRDNWETKAQGRTRFRKYFLYEKKWYSPDDAGHAGSVAKMYTPTGNDPTRPNTLKFEGSVDKYGTLMEKKHESNRNNNQKGEIKGTDLYKYQDR